MSDDDRFAGILSSPHEAALDDALWPAASGRIDQACGMRGSTLVMARGHSQADIEIFSARTCHHGERDEDWELELPRFRGQLTAWHLSSLLIAPFEV